MRSGCQRIAGPCRAQAAPATGPDFASVAVDTPGHDDPAGAEIESKEAREKLGEMAADLHNKMKALGHIHAILVLHNDVRRGHHLCPAALRPTALC